MIVRIGSQLCCWVTWLVWRVVLVNRDMEAGLPEFLLHIDQSLILKPKKPVTHPGHLATAQPGLGDVDGCAGKVGTYNISLGRSCVVIPPHQVPLILHGTYSGTDDKRLVELGIMSACEISQKGSSPRAAVAAILRERRIDGQRRGYGNRHQHAASDSIGQIGVIFNALKVIRFITLVLANERVVAATQRILVQLVN